MEAPPVLLGERRGRAHGHDVDESQVELRLEMAVEPRLGIGDREDERVVEVQLDGVDAGQHERVGAKEPHGIQGRRLDVHATVEGAVVGEKQLLERRRGVEASELERRDRGAVLPVEDRRREDGGHEHVHELPVAIDDRGVRDRSQEFWRRFGRLANGPGERALE